MIPILLKLKFSSRLIQSPKLIKCIINFCASESIWVIADWLKFRRQSLLRLWPSRGGCVGFQCSIYWALLALLFHTRAITSRFWLCCFFVLFCMNEHVVMLRSFRVTLWLFQKLYRPQTFARLKEDPECS